jgi:hypothetical protein
MLDHLANVAPMATETQRDDRAPQEAQEPGVIDARLAHLQEQEQLWFSWVTILHERLDKADMKGNLAVLEIARTRWLEAKEALQRHQSGN